MNSALDSLIIRKEKLTPPLSAEKLDELKLKKLNALLSREKEKKRFYGGLPENLSALSELRGIGFTAPEDLLDNAYAFITGAQSDAARAVSDLTSATAGRAKRIYYSKYDIEAAEDFFYTGFCEFMSGFDTALIAFPSSGEGGLNDTVGRALGRIGAKYTICGSDRCYSEIVSVIKQTSPRVYIGPPGLLVSLVKILGSRLTFRAAVTSGDTLTESAEKIIRRSGIELYPHYGLRETCYAGAFTCRERCGMHIRENDIIVEILTEDGKPANPGEEGEVVITTIGMALMPLIRYKTGDTAKMTTEPCACGSVTARLYDVKRKADRIDIAELDDALFEFKELIDYNITADESRLSAEINAVISCNTLKDAVKEKAGNVLRGYNIKVYEEVYTGKQKPKYISKRKVILSNGEH